MRLVFAGTPVPALATLRALLDAPRHEVVGLVLDATGQLRCALDGDRVAVHVLAVRDDVRAAQAVEGETRDREAALVAVLHLVVREMQHRVDQVSGLLVVDVIGEHPQPDADLRGREPSPGCVQHGLGEVCHQGAQLLVEVDHYLGWGAQDRVAEQPDRDNSHTSNLTDTLDAVRQSS